MMVKKQEEMVRNVRDHFYHVKQEPGENIEKESMDELKEAIIKVLFGANEISSSLRSRCLVWAVVATSVSRYARVLTQNSFPLLSSICMPDHSIEQTMQTMNEVGQLINQDKRLEALYLCCN